VSLAIDGKKFVFPCILLTQMKRRAGGREGIRRRQKHACSCTMASMRVELMTLALLAPRSNQLS